MGFRVIGLEAKGFFQLSLRVVQTAEPPQTDAQIVPGLGKLGLSFYRLL